MTITIDLEEKESVRKKWYNARVEVERGGVRRIAKFTIDADSYSTAWQQASLLVESDIRFGPVPILEVQP